MDIRSISPGRAEAARLNDANAEAAGRRSKISQPADAAAESDQVRLSSNAENVAARRIGVAPEVNTVEFGFARQALRALPPVDDSRVEVARLKMTQGTLWTEESAAAISDRLAEVIGKQLI